MNETPDTVHGRLLEAVHISGYSFERASKEFEWLIGEDRWKKIGQGFDNIDKFIATIDFSEFKISIENRKKISKKLANLRATQRAAAKMLGVSQPTILNDLRDDKKLSKPEPEAVPILDKTDDVDKKLSTPSGAEVAEMAVKEAEKEIKKEQKRIEIEKATEQIESGINLPEGVFEVIAINPPWPYGTKYDTGTRRVASPYPEMSIEEISKEDVLGKSATDSSLWLWTTHRFLKDSFELMKVWGFDYKATIVWNKEKIGIGQWVRMQVEFCLLGIKGKPVWNMTNQRDLITEARREHSRKPEKFYELVESICPGRKADWFGRTQRPGWTIIGPESSKYELGR